MRLDETLILRRLWEEAGDIQAGMVLITLNQAYDAYQEIVVSARRPALNVIAFRDIVEGLARRAIVGPGPYDDEAQDMELTLRPIVATVAGDDFLTALETLLQRADDEKPEAELERSPATDPEEVA